MQTLCDMLYQHHVTYFTLTLQSFLVLQLRIWHRERNSFAQSYIVLQLEEPGLGGREFDVKDISQRIAGN